MAYVLIVDDDGDLRPPSRPYFAAKATKWRWSIARSWDSRA